MTGNKKVWVLNPIERVAYKGLTQAFIGAFMAKDLLNIGNNDNKE